MSWINNYQLAELTWEKGQLAMTGLGSSSQSPTPKPIWASRTSNDTLESIVHQATFLKPPSNPLPVPLPPPPAAGQPPPDSKSATTGPCRKRNREGEAGRSCTTAASGGESDGTAMTWPLPASLQTSCKRTAPANKDHACRARSAGNGYLEDEEEEEEESNKTETTSTKSFSSANTRSRTSTVHNQSERRRRERINQKMKALQKLVPNAHKTDKASMLEEVIDYLKQLQAQVEMMSHARNMVVAAPQMMIPIDALYQHQQQQQKQQQLQMSILAAAHSASMGVGLGMGMVPTMHNVPLPHTTLLHLPTTMPTSPSVMNATPQFLHPQIAPVNNNINFCQSNNGIGSPISGHFDALAQSKNMELYMGKLAAIYQQQLHQLGSIVHGTDHAINGGASLQSNSNQGGK